MWRRAISSQLKTIATRRSLANRPLISSPVSDSTHIFGAESVKKRVEDVMPIATGHEREELEAELEGKDILEINHPVGPFGTKAVFSSLDYPLKIKIMMGNPDIIGFVSLGESGLIKEEHTTRTSHGAPAVVQSYYDRRIVGCPGGEGEDEHDVVWFWLEKGKPHQCPVCTQYFKLDVVGPGGDPEAGHDHHGAETMHVDVSASTKLSMKL